MPVYRIRIYKNWNGGAAADEWSNTYDFGAIGDIDGDQANQAQIRYVLAERNVHLTNVIFSRSVITLLQTANDSTEKPEPRVDPIGLPGLVPDDVTLATDRRALPLDMIVKIAHSSGRSRPGNNSYRGLVPTNSWYMEGGAPILTAATRDAIKANFDNVVSDNQFNWVKTKMTKEGRLVSFSDINKIAVKGIYSRDRKNNARKVGDMPTTEKQAFADLERLAIEAVALAGGLVVLKGAGKLVTMPGALQTAAGAMGTAAGGVLNVLRPGA